MSLKPSIAGVSALLASLALTLTSRAADPPGEPAPVFPREHWQERAPSELGLDGQKLDRLARLLGGRGCVIQDGVVVKAWGSQSQRGNWASSSKPVLSTLLFFAIERGKLPGVDARVAEFGWRLAEKDAAMTFAHLANMTSGYARPESPGAAWAYNDYAIQLYQKTLFDRVFAGDPDRVAAACFAPLGLEDGLSFDPQRRRLLTSVRDFARVAWFWLNRGDWDGRQVLPRRYFDAYQRPHVPAGLPVSRKAPTNDYLEIGTYGGDSSHFNDGGPGIYGFNWWFNGPVASAGGKPTWPAAPADTFMSVGAGGYCAVMIPGRNLLLVAAAANWGELEPGNADAIMNRRIGLLLEATRRAGGDAVAGAPVMPHRIDGELKRWHPLAIRFTGPKSAESAEPNPFRDHRLSVEFARGVKSVHVPGYFAADGAAAESGAVAGDQWEVCFLPDAEGEWAFHAELVRGPDAALRDDAPTEIVGIADGTFRIGPTDKSAPDLRASGLLRDVKERYFVFAGTNEPYLKGGADSPENLLAFADFDDTTPTHRYEPHAGDWRPGDLTWKDGRGKNLVGALNYLAGKGVNAAYFLTMNVKGDGDDVWPWTGRDERYRFDVSKLAQWELVFSYMDRLGILLHVVHQEQENDQLLDGGDLGPARKLYYRELIARFAHHPALVWNLGEENTNTTAQLKGFARYIRSLDPYDHPIVVHTFPSKYEDVYAPLLGDPFFAGASLQVGRMERCAQVTTTWLERSAAAGRPWAAFLDEIGPAKVGVKPDSLDPDHDDVRRFALWAPLMAGGSGAEWLFGVGLPHHDTNCEDFRSRDRMWDQTRWALEFFRAHVPVRQARPRPDLVAAGNIQCLANPGTVYAVYRPDAGECSLRLEPGRYQVHWYNPRAGGDLLVGSVARVEGPGTPSLGQPPAQPDRDWVILVRRLNTSDHDH
jgi:CubicO group peptidase (beta-lactamase class C family)